MNDLNLSEIIVIITNVTMLCLISDTIQNYSFHIHCPWFTVGSPLLVERLPTALNALCSCPPQLTTYFFVDVFIFVVA